MRELKQLVSKTASEIDRKKKGRKASIKEKENIKLLKKKLNITRGDLSIEALTEFKYQCLNNIKVVKERIRAKFVTISRRKNNMEFEKNEAAFYKNLKETNKYEGNLLTSKNLKTSGQTSGKQKEKSIEKPAG